MSEILLEAKERTIENTVVHNKLLVLEKFLIILKTNRLDHQLLEKLEKDCGFAEGLIHLLFPSGIKDILIELSLMQDKYMLDSLKKYSIEGTTNKIAYALQIRIKKLIPKESVKKIISYLMLPHHLSLGIKLALRTCHTIWKYAGDTSTDFNFYSKRGVLLVVYINSIIFYLGDKATSDKAIDEFISNALFNTVNKIAKLKKIFKIENIPFLRLWF